MGVRAGCGSPSGSAPDFFVGELMSYSVKPFALETDSKIEQYIFVYFVRKVWRYQRGNQKSTIEEGWSTQWPKDKEQKDKQWPQKVNPTTIREWTGRVSSSCSTWGTHRLTLVIISVIIHGCQKDRNVIKTNETYPWSSVTRIFCHYLVCFLRDQQINKSYSGGLMSSVIASNAADHWFDVRSS